jgi:DNA repair protein RadC
MIFNLKNTNTMKNNIINEVELYYPKQSETEQILIKNSKDAHKAVLSVMNENLIGVREEFVILYLNRANRVIGSYCEFKGGITGVSVDPRLIFSVALKCLAVAIIVAHNHPSGNLTPSKDDEELTLKLKEIGAILDIHLLDHLIVNPTGDYFSFSDNRLILL